MVRDRCGPALATASAGTSSGTGGQRRKCSSVGGIPFRRSSPHRPFAMLTVGTGLGGGFIINGPLLRGATGAGGEIGHLALVPGGDSCPCGSHGCWERYASGSALHRAAAAAGWDNQKASHEVLAAAGTLPAARRIVEGVARDLVRGILLISSALDPSQVILGGGLGSDPRFLATAQEAMAGAHVTPPRSRPHLRTAVLGPLAGAIGAADLALEPGRQSAEPEGSKSMPDPAAMQASASHYYQNP